MCDIVILSSHRRAKDLSYSRQITQVRPDRRPMPVFYFVFWYFSAFRAG